MKFSQPITDLIQRRFSCRTYQSRVLETEHRRRLRYSLASTQSAPLGHHARFELAAALKGDSKALRGLGTYGFIKDAAAFIIGATKDVGKSLEDFGYQMEKFILLATDLGLGTCWLGGFFDRSRFAQRILPHRNEIIPAVASLGYIAKRHRRFDRMIRQQARADQRRPWDWMFFEREFGTALSKQDAGEFATPLEMVRQGPSASNLQPWRIIKDGDSWHFYLRRKPGYRDSAGAKLLRTADLQRLDMGIAMCHFELTARELNLRGYWKVNDPELRRPDEYTEYTVSWIG